MPDFPPPAPAITPADVWAYAARTLTAFTGTPRIDLMGEDANFEAGAGPRKSRIDNIRALTPVASGSITADGTEQELVSYTGLGTYYGVISLHNMGGADVVDVFVYGRMSAGGPWRRYWKERFTRTQVDPLVHILPKTFEHGFRVTLRQVSGTMRVFEYAFYREAV